MEAGDTAHKSKAERVGEWLGTLIVVPTLLILFGGAVYALGDAVLSDTPVSKTPSFVDTVLASRAVVAAIRLAIIFAAAFIVISVVALVVRRQWLTRIGPVQVSEQVSDLVAENAALRNMLESAGETIEDLQDELTATTSLLDLVLDADEDPPEEAI
ncbi:MAG TPA: hypothetical protein VNM89_09690 [Solirubrobacterales bacterium]|nr:hypothetical protein [Solirubrobacterales bacterium]